MRKGSIRTQKGLSMAETMIGLGVAAALGALCFWAVPKIEENSKVAAANEQIGGMASSVKAAFPGGKSYAGLTTAGAVKGKLFYPGMETDGKESVYNGWRGLALFGPDPGAGAGGGPRWQGDLPQARFMITYAGVPDGACAKLASQAGDLEFSMVVVNGFQGEGEEAAVGSRISGLEKSSPERAAQQCGSYGAQVEALAPERGKKGRLAGNVIQFIAK